RCEFAQRRINGSKATDSGQDLAICSRDQSCSRAICGSKEVTCSLSGRRALCESDGLPWSPACELNRIDADCKLHSLSLLLGRMSACRRACTLASALSCHLIVCSSIYRLCNAFAVDWRMRPPRLRPAANGIERRRCQWDGS